MKDISRISYEKRLVQHGFERLGFGMYSTVLAKPGSDRCIKVARWDGWPSYIVWAMEHGYSGTYAPTVYHFKDHGDFYVAVMERLVCTVADCPHKSEVWYYYRMTKGIISPWRRDGETIFLHDAPDLVEFCQKLRHDLNPDDLHDRNFMMRKDGQLVLIDPLSNEGAGKSGMVRSLRIKNALTNSNEQRTKITGLELFRASV